MEKDLKQGIEEYRELVKKKYSIDLTDAQAEQQFRDLLALFQVIYRPMRKFDEHSSSRYNGDNERK